MGMTMKRITWKTEGAGQHTEGSKRIDARDVEAQRAFIRRGAPLGGTVTIKVEPA